MKKIMMICLALTTTALYAVDSGMTQEKKARGTAGVDEVYLDEVKTREAAIERNETRQEMNNNPRNRAFSESFGQIYSKEDDQQREEEKATRKQKLREGEADGAEYQNKDVWRR